MIGVKYDSYVMQTLRIDYPDSLLDSLHLSRSEFEREARLAMAVKLFDQGRLSSGQAAELAGIPKVHFLYEVGQWGVSTLQVEESDLLQDIEVV